MRRFYVGGALGVDMWAGEILLHLKEQPNYRKIELVEVLPFEGHDARWDKRSQSRMAFLKENSDFIIVVGEKQNQNSYAERNFYMVEHADCLLAVYDNNRSIRSGTGMTVHYAQQKRLPIILIHPDTAVVTRES